MGHIQHTNLSFHLIMGNWNELQERYIYERDGKNVHYIQEGVEVLLSRILRELSEMNKVSTLSRNALLQCRMYDMCCMQHGFSQLWHLF